MFLNVLKDTMTYPGIITEVLLNSSLKTGNADSIYCFKRKFVMHYDNLITDFDTDNVCTWSGACRCHSCVCNRGAPR